ncbi:hypothetical protein BCR33DRAFT_715374, partial [Rhizoclosmatium globosum]
GTMRLVNNWLYIRIVFMSGRAFVQMFPSHSTYHIMFLFDSSGFQSGWLSGKTNHYFLLLLRRFQSSNLSSE